jgi:hypothetical protein
LEEMNASDLSYSYWVCVRCSVLRATYHWVRVAAGRQCEVHQRLGAVHGEALQLVLVPAGLPFRVEQ